MASRINQPWIPFEKVEALVQLEPAILILGLVVCACLIFWIFRSHFSEERRQGAKPLFRSLFYHLILGMSIFTLYQSTHALADTAAMFRRFSTYLGLAAIFFGCTVFVKACRILAFEYFFFRHRKVAFPVLLVNLFTLLLSLFLAGWLGSEIFNLHLAPILATSAIFSLVLGLALQDTLGNLFAGVALQFDKPYEIGDWIEIQAEGQKWVGQVYEITWRATVLIAVTEETIIVPNRVMAQTKISNFSTKYRPIIRSQIYRLPFGVDSAAVKKIMLNAVSTVGKIRRIPPPKVFVADTSESWVAFRLTYFIDDYGDQFSIADEVYSKAIAELNKNGYELAGHKVSMSEQSPEPSTSTSTPTSGTYRRGSKNQIVTE